jgi:hypothetical protein
MTTLTTNTPMTAPATAAKSDAKQSRFDFSVSRDEKGAILLALAIIALWAGATVLFGYAGLIVGALSMVATMYALLVIISRG